MDQLVHQHRQTRSASPNRYRNGHKKAYRATTSRPKVITTTSRRSIGRDAKLRRSSSSPQRPKRNKRMATTNHKTPLLGEVVEVRILSSYQLGIVRYHGQKINCKKPKQRVIGIELYKHVGNSDGTWEGESYFRPKYGRGFAHFVDESITPVRMLSSAELYFGLTNAVSQKKELARVNKRQKEEIEKLQEDVATAKNDLREYFDMSKDYHELYTRSEEEKQRLKQDNDKFRASCQRLEREIKLLRDQKFYMSRDFSESERNFDHLKNMVKKSDTDLWAMYKRSLERVKSRPRIILPASSSQRKQQQQIHKPNKSQSSDCMTILLEDEPKKPEKQHPQIHRIEQQHCVSIPDDSSDTFIINEEKDDEEMSQSHALHAHEHDEHSRQQQPRYRYPREETTIIRRDSGSNENECRSRDQRREEMKYSNDDLIARPIHVEDWFMCDSPRVTFKDERLNHTQVEIAESNTVYGNMTVTTATSSSHQSFASSNNVIITPDMSPLSNTRRTPVIRRSERVFPREQSEFELLDRETTMTELFDVYCGPRDESISL